MKPQLFEEIWERLTVFLGKNGEVSGKDEPKGQEFQIRSLMKFIFSSRRALKAEQNRVYNTSEAWQKVNDRITFKPVRRLYRFWIKYAALLILLLGICLLWVNRQEEDYVELAVVAGDTIQPGSQRAELVLASGERILLNAEDGTKEVTNLGVKLVNDTQNGLLQYKTETSGTSGEVAFNTLNVPKGGEYSLILPDGSQVWLNSETSLRFPVQFAKDKREVYLNGEAYFHIQKDSTAPFHVYTNHREITVLGTSFNVSAYEDDDFWETTLVEGKVQVIASEGKVLMKPSQQYVGSNTTGKGILKNVDPELYTSWVDGKFYFKAFTFEEIVKKLERWYDFTMIYEDHTIGKMRFSGTINKHRPVEETLRYLEKTTNIYFRISGKVICAGKKNVR